jgi:hypothetical protein
MKTSDEEFRKSELRFFSECKCILIFDIHPSGKVKTGPKIIKLRLETSLKSQAIAWLKWRPANLMLEIWSPELVS